MPLQEHHRLETSLALVLQVPALHDDFNNDYNKPSGRNSFAGIHRRGGEFYLDITFFSLSHLDRSSVNDLPQKKSPCPSDSDQPTIEFNQPEEQLGEEDIQIWPPMEEPGFAVPPSEMSLWTLHASIQSTFRHPDTIRMTDYVSEMLVNHCIQDPRRIRRRSVGQTKWTWGDQCFPMEERQKGYGTRRRHSASSKMPFRVRRKLYTPCLRCWFYGISFGLIILVATASARQGKESTAGTCSRGIPTYSRVYEETHEAFMDSMT